jgi:hypothetical protein
MGVNTDQYEEKKLTSGRSGEIFLYFNRITCKEKRTQEG